LADVDVKDYCAVFYVGGHGPILDLASDPVNARLASQVCHSLWLIVPSFLTDFFSSSKRAKSRRQCVMGLGVYQVSFLQ
jgi:hypothetical protein